MFAAALDAPCTRFATKVQILTPEELRATQKNGNFFFSELRGAHVKLVYYNNKQVLRVYIMLHVTVVLYVRSEDERADTVSIHSSLCDNENPTTHSISVGLGA